MNKREKFTFDLTKSERKQLEDIASVLGTSKGKALVELIQLFSEIPPEYRERLMKEAAKMIQTKLKEASGASEGKQKVLLDDIAYYQRMNDFLKKGE